MWNDLHDHEWGGLPLMDNQAIPAGGVCGAFTVEAVRKTADGTADESYQVLDCEGKPVHKGDKLDEPLDGDGVVLDVFTGETDGEVYVQWGNGTKTVVWGSEVRVASRRTAFGTQRDVQEAQSLGWTFSWSPDTESAQKYIAEGTGLSERLESGLASVQMCTLYDENGNVLDVERSQIFDDAAPFDTRTYQEETEAEMAAFALQENGHLGARQTAISGDVAGEELADAREDDARVMESARLTEADSAYIMAGVATKHGDLGTFVRSASRNPAVYLRQAVYDTHGFTPTVREAMALWQWASKRVKAEGDPTEDIRRNMVDEFKSNPNDRAALEAQYGQVWDTNALQNDFEVLGFMAPFVVVKRKATGEKGSLMFQSNPRLYFGWAPD